ncbi:glycogen synthase GlgA [Candidatus Bipolaricaulota bacterium]|nr:glycogen synthase GlgA [Candidatus Bipolaricaulota bacterium]
MRVMFVAAEVAPFAKVGGLADVAAALPRALAELGVEAAVVAPKYRVVAERGKLSRAARFTVPVAGEEKPCTAYRGTLPKSKVPVYFLGHDPYFDRPGIYGEKGGEYPDSLARFTFLSRGALALAEALAWRPDVIHANDWHTALVPVYLRLGETGPRAKTVLTIHNLAYQGWFPADQASAIGLDAESIRLLAIGNQVNLLKGGIQAADLLTTVSPSYAVEILERGEGLEAVLRARKDDLVGVLNGVDYTVWNPARDPYLWAAYSADDPAGKTENKRRLRAELGLVDDGSPLVGMISRLAEQKGFDLVAQAFDRMMALGIQFVVLGTGDPRYEAFLQEAVDRYPGRAKALIAFSEEWAHRIEAAADIFLMPSRFEPCGLNQMYSLRYGAVPVVRATGGLKDTVHECDPVRDTGNGFTFTDYTADAMLEALGRAVHLFRRDPAAWRRLVQRGMREDHSWTRSAQVYLTLYERLLGQQNS